MAIKPLSEDMNNIQKLVIPGLDTDMDVIQKLDDEPNDVGGLSPAELKAEFDKAGNIVKEYINGELLPAISDTVAEAEVRAEAEAGRVQAETEREEAEEARAEAEAARAEAETGREAAENGRVTAEEDRTAAEVERADAEAARAEAETERETAESGRVTAEAARAAAEAARETAEAERAAAELERVNAEVARTDAETERVEAEEARAAAEAARAEAERQRADTDAGIVAQAGEKAAQAATQAAAAEASAQAAQESKEAIEGMTVSAVGLPSGQEATVEKTLTGGVVNLLFGLPAGPQGPAGTGSSPYEAAVEAGYTGTEAEFYAALVTLKDAPFLPLNGGGVVTKHFEVVSGAEIPTKYIEIDTHRGIFKIDHSLTITQPVDALNNVQIEGGLDVRKGAEIRGGLNVHPANGQPATELNVDGKIYCSGLMSNTGSNEFGPIGSVNTRFNTIYIKKVDASEHVITPKIRPPEGAGTQYLRFITKNNVAPNASPNPLPVEWGGTGATSVQDFFAAANAAGVITKGDKGDPGAAGAPGAAGKSAYQAAVQGGYTGTEAAFNAALAGVSSAGKIATGYWVGTGTYGENNPNTLTLPFAAKLIWIYGYIAIEPPMKTMAHTGSMNESMPALIVPELLTSLYTYPIYFGNGYNLLKKSSDGKTFQFYSSVSAANQANYSGYKYFWIAFG